MNRYKVCVYAICKNEEKFVNRWMDSVLEADQVIVLDTGSTDATVDKLRARGATVCEEIISPWRFDVARNVAMDLVPEDADICVSIDLDEVFDPGWRAALERAWKPEHTRAKYLYTWTYHADGTPDKQYTREKIHRRHGYRWVQPVHEVLQYDGEEKEVWAEGVVVHHHPDPEKSRGQYLPLLELAAQEEPENDRTAFWLGRERMYHGHFDGAIEELKRHLSLPGSRWDEERAASMRCIAHCYAQKGNMTEARSWLFRALAECPRVREPYLALARLGYRQQNWPLMYCMAEEGLKITERTGSYLLEPECWGPALADFGAIAAYRLGAYPRALALAKMALSLDAGNPRLEANLKSIEAKIAGDAP